MPRSRDLKRKSMPVFHFPRRPKGRFLGLKLKLPFLGSKDEDSPSEQNEQRQKSKRGSLWMMRRAATPSPDGAGIVTGPAPPRPLEANSFGEPGYPSSPFTSGVPPPYLRNARSLDFPLSPSPVFPYGCNRLGTPVRCAKAPDLGVVEEGTDIIGGRPSESKSGKRHSMSRRFFSSVFGRSSKERSQTPESSLANPDSMDADGQYAMSQGTFSASYVQSCGYEIPGPEGPRCPPDNVYIPSCPPDNVFIPSGDYDHFQSLDSPMTYLPSPVVDAFGRSSSMGSMPGRGSSDTGRVSSPWLQLWDPAEFVTAPRTISPFTNLVPGWQGYDPRTFDVGTGVRTDFCTGRSQASDWSSCDSAYIVADQQHPADEANRRSGFDGSRQDIFGHRSPSRMGHRSSDYRSPSRMEALLQTQMRTRNSMGVEMQHQGGAEGASAEHRRTRSWKSKNESMAKNVFGGERPSWSPSTCGTQTTMGCFQDISGTNTPNDPLDSQLSSTFDAFTDLMEHPITIEPSQADSIDLSFRPQLPELEDEHEDDLHSDEADDSSASQNILLAARPSSSLGDAYSKGLIRSSNLDEHEDTCTCHGCTRKKSRTRKRFGSQVESLSGWQPDLGSSRELGYDDFVAQGQAAITEATYHHFETAAGKTNERPSFSLSEPQITSLSNSQRPTDKPDITACPSQSRGGSSSLRNSIDLAYTSDGPCYHRSMCFETGFSTPVPSANEEGLSEASFRKTIESEQQDNTRVYTSASDFTVELDWQYDVASHCDGSFREDILHDDGIPDYPTEPAFSDRTESHPSDGMEGEDEGQTEDEEENVDMDVGTEVSERSSERELVEVKTRKTWMDELEERAELRRKECTYRIACQRAIMQRMKEQVQASKLAFERIKSGLCPQITVKLAQLRRRWGGKQRAKRREKLVRARELESEQLWDDVPLQMSGCGLLCGQS